MARASRKVSLNAAETVSSPVVEKAIYKTAVYARLSAEDRQKSDGNSLETQILMVKKYIEETPDLSLCGVFSDNGATGTNFNRPGFENLMEEIRRGRINCIVVKDLSRFGRDYVEAGNFLEVIFPHLNVRFISIGDNYDNFDPRCQGEGICVALKNMINAFYAKDISIKTQTAYAAKQRKGDFYAGCPPFGYIKSPKNKNKLIVDNEAAVIVRDIFRWKTEGMSLTDIGKRLNEKKIPTPGNYHYMKGTYRNKRFSSPMRWDGNHIRAILENEVYLGHTVNGKYRVNPNQTYDYSKQPKEKWITVENTHEALVSRREFDIVAAQLQKNKERYQEMLNKNPRQAMPENIFQGLVFCADCGGIIQRKKGVSKDNKTLDITYFCPRCRRNNAVKTTKRNMRLTDLHEAVHAGIVGQIALCADKRKKIKKIVSTSETRQDSIDREIRRLQQEFNAFPVRRKKLYDDFCDGLFSESEYRLLNERQNKKYDEIPFLLSRLESEKKKYQPEFVDENEWITSFEKFRNIKSLTRDMLSALIERIEIKNNAEIEVQYRYADEYSLLDEFITENGGGQK